MLCSTHLGMQIGEMDLQKKENKRERSTSPHDVDGKQFPTPSSRASGLSGTLTLASVCATHVKCVSVQPYRQNLDFP